MPLTNPEQCATTDDRKCVGAMVHVVPMAVLLPLIVIAVGLVSALLNLSSALLNFAATILKKANLVADRCKEYFVSRWSFALAR